MNYTIGKNFIKINDKSQFNIEHILECGQVFCFDKIDEKYIVFPGNKYAEIIENESDIIIYTKDIDYFINWFDLNKDYNEIKDKLKEYKILSSPIKFGYGIRILKQDKFETLISFIISANNNIKRIKKILNNLRIELGENGGNDIKSFPNIEKLKNCDVNFFKKAGAGYRAEYLVKVLKSISLDILEEFDKLPTKELRNKLISLSGVGPKVADCILLFAYNRFDVFPVDTWIEHMYNSFYPPLNNRLRISQNLVDEFGFLSGYAQQYLFYYQRSFLGKDKNKN